VVYFLISELDNLLCYVFVKRIGKDFCYKTGKYDVKPGYQGNASVIVCFSITNLQIAGDPGEGGVIKSVISYTQFANKLRMAIKAHATGIIKIYALWSNRHHID
jgi:hypothetical protein